MSPIFFRTVLAVTVSASLLTACNKADTAKTDAPKADATASVVAPASTPAVASAPVTATATAKSPTVNMYMTTFKMGTVGMLNAEKPLTKEQTACLMSKEADTTYYTDAQTELNNLIGAEGIAESDKFYETDVGKKLVTYIDQQQAQAMGQPITGAPVVITEADKKAAADFTKNNPKMKEIENKLKAGMGNQQAMMAKMQNFITKEKSRCHIG